MSSTGLLILSNINNIKSSLIAAQKCVKYLYIHINLPKTKEIQAIPTPAWRHLIKHIYADCFRTDPQIDVRILTSPFKYQQIENPSCLLQNEIQILFSDLNYPEIYENFQKLYNIQKQPIILNDCSEQYLDNFQLKNIVSSTTTTTDDGGNSCSTTTGTTHDGGNSSGATTGTNDGDGNSSGATVDDNKIYGTVVIGGTFDRIHIGHKILLTEAILRANKKIIVGVTSNEMVKSKKLHELILPVEQRIKDVENFLIEIDNNTIEYDVIAINDAYGPTVDDPNIDLIIVSTETLRGGHQINEARIQEGLNPLVIQCVDLIKSPDNDSNQQRNKLMELKISSSNNRINMLGTRIREPEPRPNLPESPYIIGLTGGIASGKSKMAERFADMGAIIMDCDKIAHEIYEPHTKCYLKIVSHFGTEILTSDNQKINRQTLGAIVFNDQKKLNELNAIVWPELLLEVKRRIQQLSLDINNKIIVIEAAVLFQANWQTECHEVWTMIVSPKEATERIMSRNNLTEDEARKRINSQLDNLTLVSKSNIVFSSEWSPQFTRSQAWKAWNIIINEICG